MGVIIIRVCDRCGAPIDTKIPCSVPRYTKYDVITPKGVKVHEFKSGIEQQDIDICPDCLWQLAYIMDIFFGGDKHED